MGEFFSGWRRKIGLVTLVMACVLMAGSFRSRIVRDQLAFYRPQAIHVITSMDGEIDWVRHVRPDCDGSQPINWGSKTITEILRETAYQAFHQKSWADCRIHWRWHWYGFDFGAKSGEMSKFKSEPDGRRTYEKIWMRVEVWQIPYWSLTLPLTLISAWLLISKPRKSNQKKIKMLTANEGAIS